jgi:hypothetical protein
MKVKCIVTPEFMDRVMKMYGVGEVKVLTFLIPVPLFYKPEGRGIASR